MSFHTSTKCLTCGRAVNDPSEMKNHTHPEVLKVGSSIKFREIPFYQALTTGIGLVTRYGFWEIEGDNKYSRGTYWYVKFPKHPEVLVNDKYLEVVYIKNA
jgi:hypothetical protein